MEEIHRMNVFGMQVNFVKGAVFMCKECGCGSVGKNTRLQFIVNGYLDMERILECFVVHFQDIYGLR